MSGIAKARALSRDVAASGIALMSLLFGWGSSMPLQAEESYRLEEVVVVARRREEGLQDTPVSVTALSAEALQQRSLQGIADLQAFVPNLSFTPGASASPSAAQLFVRGIGQQDFLPTFDAGVGVYVDGVYIARAVGAQFDFFDIERIEVLRGPQGTLFGRNTIGGAINLISTRPEHEFGAMLRATVGRFDRRDLNGFVNIPLGDELAIRVSAATLNRDGYGERPLVGDEQGVMERRLVRASALYDGIENLELLFSADVTQTDETPLPQTQIDLDTTQFPLVLYNGLVARGDIGDQYLGAGVFTNFGTEPNVSEVDNGGLSLTATYSFPGFDVKSITGWRDLDATFSRAFENVPFPVAETITEQDQDQFSQELQAFGSAFDARLDWIVGAYYFREDVVDVANVRLFDGLYDALEGLPGPIPGLPFGGAGNPANLILDLPRVETNRLENRSYALFGEATWEFRPSLTMIFGARYTWEEKDYRFDRFLPNTGRNPIDDVPAAADFEAFTPKLGLQWQASTDTLLYATYTQGFKSGGFNGRPTTGAGIEPFDEETADSLEVGVKSELLQNRLRANIAVFYSDYEDLQVGINRPVGPNLEFFVENAASASIQGFEVELTALLGQGLTLNAAAGYTDAEFDDIDPAIVAFSRDSAFAEVPEWTFNVGAGYSTRIFDAFSLQGRVDYAWKDDTWHDLNNTPAIRTADYGLLSARVAIAPASDLWSLAVFGTNLTDERYLLYGSSGFGLVNGSFGRPREWGLSLAFHF